MKIIATNRKALRDFHVLDSYDAGIVLKGSEAKSLRQGTVSISDAYGNWQDGEIYLINLHITNYKHSSHEHLDPKRKRKLLLHKKQIKKLYGLSQQRGNTLIPLKIYFNDKGFAKVTLGVCRRKRQYDKKEQILKAEMERKVQRIKKSTR